MKKTISFFFTLCLSLLFVLGACAAPADPADNGGGKKPDNDPPSLTEEETPPGLWDTSDIDISHIHSQRLIAFTFDDGPTEQTEALLQVFEDFNDKNPDWQAHATLFTLGSKITDASVSLLQRAHAEGMELGNHSFSHANLTELSDEEIASEIQQTDLLLKKADGKEKHLFRPPGGHYSDPVLSLSSAPFINWTDTLDTSDWSGTSENDIYNKISSNLIDGGIVLMHQGYTTTVNAVSRLLPELKQRGFQVVSVSELAKAYGIKMYAGQAYTYLG